MKVSQCNIMTVLRYKKDFIFGLLKICSKIIVNFKIFKKFLEKKRFPNTHRLSNCTTITNNLLEFSLTSSFMKTETTIPRLASRKQPDKTRLHPSLLKKNAPTK